MTTPRRSSTKVFICLPCTRVPRPQSRQLHSSADTTSRSEGVPAWRERAAQVAAGKRKSMLSILEERGLVKQLTGRRADVDRHLTSTRAGIYAGFDPTAPSLHVGHLLPLMALFWMYVHGYKTCALVGGATVRIGDPTGRLKARTALGDDEYEINTRKVTAQLDGMWANVRHCAERNGLDVAAAGEAVVENNARWWKGLSFLDVVEQLGHGVRIGPMLARETVKQKLGKGDGMSFAEFTYPLMQAWDWWELYRTQGIQVQIGGSDQYGNVTAGLDALNYLTSKHRRVEGQGWKVDQQAQMQPFGLTVPLLESSSGQKFGKSAGNAIWLDAEQTSPFDLYGYFMRTPDAMVKGYLLRLTFIPVETIDELIIEHQQSPQRRVAQARLAKEFLTLVHGSEVAEDTAARHAQLFSKKPVGGPDGAGAPLATPPVFGSFSDIGVDNTIPISALDHPNAVHALVRKFMIRDHSSSVAHHLVSKGAIYVFDPRVAAGQARTEGEGAGLEGGSDSATVAASASDSAPPQQWRALTLKDNLRGFLVDGKRLIFRRGKAKIRVVDCVDVGNA